MPAVEKCMGPLPGTGPYEVIALKQPFAASGKLRPRVMEISGIARNAQMPLDVLAFIQLSALPVVVRYFV